MFGMGFGSESEARDAQRHGTGRRHGARELNSDQGMSSAAEKTMMAQRAHDTHRAEQALNMQKAPSFMEQMYMGESRKKTEKGPVAQKHVDGREKLNVFAWESTPKNQDVPHRGRVIERSEAELRSLKRSDAASRRDGDAQKFTTNQDGNFLRFSDNPKAPMRKPLGKQNNPAPYAVDYPQSNVPEKDANARPMRRRAPEQPAPAGPEFEGFPGMGKSSPQKNIDHIERCNQESNIFPPSVSGMETPMSHNHMEAELIQRMHQQRKQADVGTATTSPQQQQRNMGPYTTSNGSYGVDRLPKGGSPQSSFSPSLQSMTPQAMTPQAMSPKGQQQRGGMSEMQQLIQQQYQPPALAPNAGRVVHGQGCECCPPQQPKQQYPPLYPESESSTPRYLRDHNEYGDAATDDERELYEYEQQLRMRLMKARQEQDRGDAVAYDYSQEKGFVETPREEGAPRWLDDGSVTPSEAISQGDRRVRFNM